MGVIMEGLAIGKAAIKGINLQGWVGVIVSVALAALLVIQTGKTHDAQRSLATANANLVTAQQTIINYQQAAEKARQADAQNKARAEAEQRAVVQRTKEDYEARIDRARADAQRLRDRLARPANPGSPGAAPVSSDHRAGPAAPGPSADQGLSIDERLIATEQAIQLDALIDYVQGILKVDLNGTATAPQSEPSSPRP
jgi:hypothetical protein